MRSIKIIENWLIGDYLLKNQEEVNEKHRATLIARVMLVFTFMYTVLLLLSVFVNDQYLVLTNVVLLFFYLGLICYLKFSQKINTSSYLFLAIVWITLFLFITVYGDPSLVNIIWILSITLVSLFLLNKKYGW